MLLSGNWIAVCAFLVWGLLPLYFQYIPNSNVFEILAIRVLFSIPFIYLLLKLVSIPSQIVWQAMRSKRTLLLCFLAGLFNCVSLYSFTWAVTNGQVLAASLGYFINPIFSIILGVIFLKDRLSKNQKAAVALSLAGIGYQVMYYGELPWLSLIMGGAFALYGLIKKFVNLDALSIMLIELITMLPIALFILFGEVWQGSSVWQSGDTTTMWLYLLSAPITLIPLLLFSLAVERTSLVMIGFIQYIEPSLQFLLAVIVFGEVLLQVKVVSFGLIWLGLLLCLADMTMKKPTLPPSTAG
ncbi:MAG TPA: EamA family transporter RarD [Vibrio sp.]|uniref:EamA family transporter RarD n=1 Tax=Vibrio marinisediminis TaxID=2758441 RepID=A0A7W2FN52_9VIBR|nr:EamA family transporter RarD [Vibrio marinisediminis]MBA5761103.1 EamA family transporter RarD [Vibrio marinisediminis]HAS61352.1 EamA family transporter RarD [Vibrio sp.]